LGAIRAGGSLQRGFPWRYHRLGPCSAVKEFCHSDFARTMPSLSTLLGVGESGIIQLDVEEVELPWL
jgi:hypothetical protein